MPDSDDFSVGKLPKRWLPTVKIAVLAGAFFASFMYATRDREGGGSSGRDAIIEKNVAQVLFEIESLKSDVEAMKAAQDNIVTQNRDLRRGIQEIARKVEAMDDQDIAELRHNEVMSILRVAEKKWKR